VIPGKTRDFVFPVWIVRALPVGLSGLVLAGIFAAAISSLDSILAALSQTTLSLFYHPERAGHGELDHKALVWRSRLLVVVWGVALTGFTLLLNVARNNIPILPLAFGMTAYTFGPLLGMMLCALVGRGSVRGLAVGAALSFLLVLFLRTDVWVLLRHDGRYFSWLEAIPTYTLNAGRTVLTPLVSYVWAWPVTTILTFVLGTFWPGDRRHSVRLIRSA
jgi:Na+/proline symporter